jgi:hypothetical protein
MNNYKCILLFLLLFLLYKKLKLKENFSDKLFNGLQLYRIGDMIKSKEYRKKDGIWGKEYHLKMFPNSIASEYLKLTDDINDYELLKKIISKRELSKNFKLPKEFCLVHIRVGDVIDNDNWTVKQFLEKDRTYLNRKYNYVRSRKYFLEKINKLKKLNVKNIVIIAGSHLPLNNFNKSYEYLDQIIKIFEDNNFNVQYYYGNHPDDDIIIGYKTKYLIQSNGGYSYLLSKITNGKVI